MQRPKDGLGLDDDRPDLGTAVLPETSTYTTVAIENGADSSRAVSEDPSFGSQTCARAVNSEVGDDSKQQRYQEVAAHVA
jgi:hypothetical protein